jgi:hypothetical protein
MYLILSLYLAGSTYHAVQLGTALISRCTSVNDKVLNSAPCLSLDTMFHVNDLIDDECPFKNLFWYTFQLPLSKCICILNHDLPRCHCY